MNCKFNTFQKMTNLNSSSCNLYQCRACCPSPPMVRLKTIDQLVAASCGKSISHKSKELSNQQIRQRERLELKLSFMTRKIDIKSKWTKLLKIVAWNHALLLIPLGHTSSPPSPSRQSRLLFISSSSATVSYKIHSS